jgi:phosphate transport system protein
MTGGIAREMPEHTVRSYEEELRRLRDMIVRMGGLAEQQVADATSALVRRDTDLAAEVVQRPSSSASWRCASPWGRTSG